MNDNILLKIKNKYIPKYVVNYNNFNPKKDTVLYSGPYWNHLEIEAIIESIIEGNWIVSGEQVEKFQDAFSKRFNVTYSHMVNSGSSANLVMISALKKRFNWQENDEIIVSPVGFPTTIAPIIQNNLKPVFIDIEFSTLNFDISQIEDSITKKTKAIFVSPVLGNPPDLEKLKWLCEKYGLLLIGDNCDSLGSMYNNKFVHEYYYAWSCSFYPAHHITTGEGGMVCTNDKDLYNISRSISWWGRDCYCVGVNNTLACGTCNRRFDYWLKNYNSIIDHKYIYGNIGYNLKPLDLQGAVGLVQLSKFEEIDQKRKYNKTFIENSVVDHVKLEKVKVLEKANPCWFGVPIVCNNQDEKTLLVSHFEYHKIQTRNYFGGNILLHPAYEHLDDYKKFPNANKVLDLVFFLGCSPSYTNEVLEHIDNVVKLW